MAEPLKNHFDRAVVELLAERFAQVHSGFDRVGFTDDVLDGLASLELKGRINLLADRLRAALPDDYPRALAMVVDVAETDGVEGFTAWPLCSFVERHGRVDPAASLAAMERLTRRFSCEFAVRPFLEHHLDLTVRSLHEWTGSEHEEVRRLPSEGTRPHLPWGPKVQALLDDPSVGVGLITELRHDPSTTVRRSVANHLNDIARSDPALVVDLATAWSGEATDPAMLRHGLRSLVKKGHPGALAVLGFTTDPHVRVEHFAVAPDTIHLGDSIELSATITSTAVSSNTGSGRDLGPPAQRLVVDFVVHHLGARGTTKPKVFKWTTIELAPGATATVVKRRRIATASTRRYHAGLHRVELQVGGTIVASSSFDLLDSSD